MSKADFKKNLVCELRPHGTSGKLRPKWVRPPGAIPPSQELSHRRAYVASLRKKIIDALGGCCARCGYSDIRALQIDHINGVRCDNRFSNLREATAAENGQNQAVPRHNTSGFMGVHWNRRAGNWQARIMIAGRNKYLGYFDTPEAAHAAYCAAKAKHHTFNPVLRDYEDFHIHG